MPAITLRSTITFTIKIVIVFIAVVANAGKSPRLLIYYLIKVNNYLPLRLDNNNL